MSLSAAAGGYWHCRDLTSQIRLSDLIWLHVVACLVLTLVA